MSSLSPNIVTNSKGIVMDGQEITDPLVIGMLGKAVAASNRWGNNPNVALKPTITPAAPNPTAVSANPETQSVIEAKAQPTPEMSQISSKRKKVTQKGLQLLKTTDSTNNLLGN